MTTPGTAKWSNGEDWRSRVATGWPGLAASPTCALMAWITANGPPRIAVCSPPSGLLPIDGMAWMYLLMCVFHLAPWLRLAVR